MDQWKRLMEKAKTFAEKIKWIYGRMDRQQKKRGIAVICAAALIVTLAVMPMIAANNNEEDGPVASILSGKAELGSVTTTVHGGGVLAEDDPQAIRLPDGVKLTEFLVENYSTVKQGDPLATVDKVTVMTAISSVQETLDTLKEEMEDAGTQTVTKTIKAEAGGKVKAVYAEKGDDVSAVMTEYGALAVLSLDGLMAVEIETNAKLSAGDSVWVGFADGRDVVGRVESALNGKAVITVTDDDYAIGEQVVIADSDDDRLGEGTLYVHNAWNAVAYSGTVSAVSLRENTTVSAGKTIFNLKNVEQSSQFQSLSQKHREYEELMLELFEMYQYGALLAPCDGVVSGVDRDSVHLLSTDGATYSVSMLANAPIGETDAVYDNYVGQITEVIDSQWTVMLNPENWGDVDYAALDGVSVDTALMTDGPKQMTFVTVFEAVDGVWQIVTGDVQQGDVLLFASDGSACVWAIRLVKAEQDDPETPAPTDPVTPEQPDTGESSPEKDQNGTTQTPSSGSGMSSFGGQSGMSGGLGMNTQESTSDLFDLNGTNILYVTPQNTMTLTVTVDETDIGKISVGQQAQVTVDVLSGETYTATVTEVGTTGTNSGGNSKYTVELTLARAENMLAGQSASAVFTLETTENVVVVPAAALTENGSETVIYTAKSGDTLTKPVTVTTGASDGSTVEISSGLTEGQTYYYEYYDTLELSTAVKSGGTFGR